MMTVESLTSKAVVQNFWSAMQTNDFRLASAWLHADYTLDWPQSGETISGRENFIAINERYPAHGEWRFTIRRILAEGPEVVTEVDVTDGAVLARAITFSTIQDGRIIRQVEYWPDPFEPADWRAAWVEKPPGNS